MRRMLWIIALPLMLSSCAFSPLRSSPDLKSFYSTALPVPLGSDLWREGQWERIDKQTLRLVGSINNHLWESFSGNLTPETRKIQLNSGGGEVVSGLGIAGIILERKLDVEVVGECVSSCANYIFMAGSRKTVLQNTYLGFHGDWSNSRYFNGTLFQGATAWRSGAETSELEQAFYRRVGVDPKLYRFSVDFVSSTGSIVWSPTQAELVCYGVKNVTVWDDDAARRARFGPLLGLTKGNMAGLKSCDAGT